MDAGDGLLMRALDEMDHGVLLVSIAGRLIYSNELGFDELDSAGPLRLEDGCIVAVTSSARSRLRTALAGTVHGRRQLLVFGDDDESVPIAVTPMSADGVAGDSIALLVFGRRSQCTTLAIDFYARSKRLTGAEAAILVHLTLGLEPAEIAREQGVAMSTIRSQIASLRQKTRAASIRELLERVARLPPIRIALRSSLRSSFGAPRPAAVARGSGLRSEAVA